MSELSSIEILANQSQKIQAIKKLRDLTGLGLKDAKDAVEHYQAHGQWPFPIPASAAPPPPPAREEPVMGLEPLVPLEQFIAQGKVIQAIKGVRALTAWGLKDSKDAVDTYRMRRAWPASLLALLQARGATASAVPSPTSPAPGPATPGSPAPGSPTPGSPAMLQALAQHLGHAAEIRLCAPARHDGGDGQLVILRDRTCLVREHAGQWALDPILWHASLTQVETESGPPAVLHLSDDYRHERFELAPAEAEAALALLRVFAP